MLSQCYAQMKISFPGLIFAQYKSINIIIIIIIIILLKESAIRFLSEVKVPSIEMFGDAAFLSPGKTFFIVLQKAL